MSIRIFDSLRQASEDYRHGENKVAPAVDPRQTSLIPEEAR